MSKPATVGGPIADFKKDIEDRVRKAAREEVIKWTIIMWIVKRYLG